MSDKDKVEKYSQSNYNQLQNSLSFYMETINYQLGFSLVRMKAPLLSELALRGNVNMYLSLITDLLLLLLIYLSSNLLLNLTKIMVSHGMYYLLMYRRFITGWEIIVPYYIWEEEKKLWCNFNGVWN